MRRGLLSTVVAAALLSSGCAPASDPSPAELYGVATFEVAGYADETYRIGLATPELLEHALRLRDGTAADGRIPVGIVVRDGDGGVNEPWSWHIDPSTLEFADMTTEVCDGLPSFVEREEVTSPAFCPWLTRVTDVEILR